MPAAGGRGVRGEVERLSREGARGAGGGFGQGVESSRGRQGRDRDAGRARMRLGDGWERTYARGQRKQIPILIRLTQAGHAAIARACIVR